MPVEIMQNEESGKPEAPAPEGIRNPGIQVIIIRRRSIICIDGSTFVNIIIVDFFRIGIPLSGGSD
jgi:hypothetical protein